jgi:hypothetical protein
VELRSPVCQPQAPDDDINDDAINDGVAQSDGDQGPPLFAGRARSSDSLDEAQGLPVGVIVRHRPAPRFLPPSRLLPGGACARITRHVTPLTTTRTVVDDGTVRGARGVMMNQRVRAKRRKKQQQRQHQLHRRMP